MKILIVEDEQNLRETIAASLRKEKFVVEVKDGEGISIDFSAVQGEPVLNAVRIYRNY